MAQPHFMWLVNFKIQVYWLESANGYDKTMELGPEISIFNIICIKDISDKTNHTRKSKTLEQAKILANCIFLDRKLVNLSMETVLLAQERTNNCALHEIQKKYASSISLVPQAALKMSAYLTPARRKQDGDKQTVIKSPLTKLKNSLSRVGKVNQSINQF